MSETFTAFYHVWQEECLSALYVCLGHGNVFFLRFSGSGILFFCFFVFWCRFVGLHPMAGQFPAGLFDIGMFQTENS